MQPEDLLKARLAKMRSQRVEKLVKQQKLLDSAPRHTQYQGYRVGRGVIASGLGGGSFALPAITNGLILPGQTVSKKGGFVDAMKHSRLEDEEVLAEEISFAIAILIRAYPKPDTFGYLNLTSTIGNAESRFVAVCTKKGDKYTIERLQGYTASLLYLRVGDAYIYFTPEDLSFPNLSDIAQSGFDFYKIEKDKVTLLLCRGAGVGKMSPMQVSNSSIAKRISNDSNFQQVLKLSKSIDLLLNFNTSEGLNLVRGSLETFNNEIPGCEYGLVVKYSSGRCVIANGFNGCLIWDLSDSSNRMNPACYFGFANPIFANDMGIFAGIIFLGSYGSEAGIVVRLATNSLPYFYAHDCFIPTQYLQGEQAIDISELLDFQGIPSPNIPLRGHTRSPLVPHENIDFTKVIDQLPGFDTFPDAWKFLYPIDYLTDKNAIFYR
jgi:hypothetical protein